MLVPIGSDTHDGSIGWFSLGLIVVCLAVFVGTWPKQTDFEVSLQTDSLSVWSGSQLRRMADSLYELEHPDARNQPRGSAHDFGAIPLSMERIQEQAEGIQPVSPDSLAKALGVLTSGADSSRPVRYEDTAHNLGRSDAEIALEMVELQAKIRSDKRLGLDFEQRIKSRIRSIRGTSPLLDWGFVPSGNWFPGILTSMFLHASWGHLIGNMLFFWLFREKCG